MNGTVNTFLRHAWKLIILVIGGTVLLLGIILLVTPGPAFIVIPIGLAILATEFAWAKRLLKRVKAGVHNVTEKLNINLHAKPADGAPTESRHSREVRESGGHGVRRQRLREKW